MLGVELAKTGEGCVWVPADTGANENVQMVYQTDPAALSAGKHDLSQWCRLELNCDKLDEKMKLSLNPGGAFCKAGVGLRGLTAGQPNIQ